MQSSTLYQTLRVVSHVVIALGGLAICYATAIASMYWSGIGV